MPHGAAAEAQPGLRKSYVWSLSAAHCMNDLVTTGIVPALLPLYKQAFGLTYMQTGLIVFSSYVMSSVMQPLLGLWTDKHPRPWLLAAGVALSCFGLALTGLAPSFAWVLVFVALSGLGSGAFHPEASRATHFAAGSAKGLAQAIFQVGGNAGQSFGPLMIPLFLLATGIHGLTAFFVLSAAAFGLLWRMVPWYKDQTIRASARRQADAGVNRVLPLTLFVIVVIARSWCQIGVAGFLPFYYLHQHISLAVGEWMSFLFLACGAVGTFLGGAMSDKLGRKGMLTWSLAASVPFAALLPVLHGVLAGLDLAIFGFTVLSSFAVSVIYAQMLLPRNLGLASGLTIGLGVGAGGIGAALFGRIADVYGIPVVFHWIVALPVVGAILAAMLPSDRKLTPSSKS
ncbi:MAG: MFS transporter [Alicyclobacillus sp.]|nr:MFS transporter [Alicyclobacillus sp.]